MLFAGAPQKGDTDRSSSSSSFEGLWSLQYNKVVLLMRS